MADILEKISFNRDQFDKYRVAAHLIIRNAISEQKNDVLRHYEAENRILEMKILTFF